MVWRWLKSHLSVALTGTAIVALAGGILTVAVISDGYATQRLDLSDGSVWVANGQNEVIGRANTEILELNSVVTGEGTELDIVQRGQTVLLLDRVNTLVGIVDPATSSVQESVALPTESPEVFLAGDNVVIYAAGTGEVWIVDSESLTTFDSSAEATLSLGQDSALTVSASGVLVAYSSETNQLSSLDATSQLSTVESEPVAIGGLSRNVSITTVGDRVVLFESVSNQLWVDGRTLELDLTPDESAGAVLQAPGPDADSVLLGTRAGLLSASMDASSSSFVVRGRSGTPAAPIVVGDCRYAGWSDGFAQRDCAGEASKQLELVGMPASAARLQFAVNDGRVVLNEPRSGATWAVQADGEPIDNWQELLDVEQDQEEVEQQNTDAPPEYEKNQLPPVALDDEFGARPSRSTVLPVLLNDYDPNGDVLVISELSTIDDSLGTLELVHDRQQIQLTLSDAAVGSFAFTYSISDGRGGAASATVHMTVRAPQENSAPVQVRQSRTLVAQGARVTSSVLGEWVDPDGDAFYLTSASTAEPDSVSYKPEGTVVFQEGGAAATLRSVSLVVSDGSAEATGSLSITVNPAGEVPIIADPFIVRAYAGTEVKISPLEHVRGGTGPLRLSGVPNKTGAVITANYDAGTFRFASDQPRTFYLDFVVTDGNQSVTGQLRVDVETPPEANSKPITVPKTVFVRTLSSESIDVASLDKDPSGGVLLVTGTSELPVASGVRVEVLDQRALRVTLVGPLDDGPVSFNYTITNGLAIAEGVVTVIEIPELQVLQAPVATDDSATVRVGDTIDIPVLSNDIHPDGEELTLNPILTEDVKAGAGLLFVSGNKLRFLATEQTGNFTAVYEISGPDGQTSQAQVKIAVREVVEATNSAPTPSTVVARVIAGEKVTIRIPLTGIDPDGDSVVLLGQESNPQKGAVTALGSDTIEYEAGGYSAGTDTFMYTVIDSLGARASGTVRVGISPPVEGARNPVATADEVRTRPGGSVSIQVLANDSDPDGSALSIVSVVPNSLDITAEIVGDVIRVDPPSEPGNYGLVYTIENEFGGTSSNFIRVEVDPEAPLAYPIASDSVLVLSDVLERDEVTIDVLSNVFFADGSVSSLDVEILDGYSSNATVLGDKRVRVTIADKSQIIPFSVSHPDDSDVVSYAFIRVPGFDDALPQLDRRAKSIEVESESSVKIDLNDYVVAVGDSPVILTDTTTVQATHSNGDNLVVDSDTLEFTSADKYFGPASISFEVTDGATVGEEGAHTATLVLPITVTPRENQPPVFVGASLEFEPDEERVLDLLKLTNYPYPDDVDELDFTALEPLPTGFSYTLRGSTLTLSSDEDAVKGSSTSLTLGVRDDLSEGQSGRISLKVVASTRPLTKTAPDSAITPRGKTTTIDVLANDSAGNPFPGEAMRVVAIRGADGASLPSGVSVVPSENRSVLAVTVSANAQPVDAHLQYQVADATGDPDRYVWGNVTLSVQDVPDPPSPAVRAGGHTNGTLTLKITPPAFNNSPITKYEVVGTGANSGYRKDCGLQQLCTLSDLTVGTSYEFQVIATNAIGESQPGALSAPLRVDYLPAAPASVTAVASRTTEAELVIRWDTVPNPSPGTPVVGYTVRIAGAGVGQVDITVGAGGNNLTTTAGGLIQAGQPYQVSVFARNSAQASVEEWNRNPPVAVTAIGRPTPVVGLSASSVGTDGAIRVDWSAGSWNGTASGSYAIARFPTAANAPTSCTSGGARPGAIAGATAPGWIDTTATDGQSYVYAVYSDNGYFCTITVSGPIEVKKAPGKASLGLGLEAQADGNYDAKVTSLSVASGSAVRYEYHLGDGVWKPVAVGGFVTSAADSSVYGYPVNVIVRGCRDQSAVFCGPSSNAVSRVPLQTRASVPSCLAGSPIAPSLPRNNGVSGLTVTYQVSSRGLLLWGPFVTMAPGEPLPPGTTAVRIKATVNDGSDDYRDPEYGETTCG